MAPGIVPPFLLRRVAAAAPERFAVAPRAALETLRHDDEPRRARAGRVLLSLDENDELVAELAPAADRTIFDAGHTETLPGAKVRGEGDAPSEDATVNEAYDGLGATFDLYSEVYGRDSIDGAGMGLEASVHYGENYDNAFWNGDRMVFGDGDGEVFGRFTASVSVIGHELTHGVTQHTAGLVYANQAGALNESVSDVFGALVEQYQAGQTVSKATWLIGAGLFTKQVKGTALRSMKAPGTAYDDDVLGRDPQPAHMKDYDRTRDDNGGVHINSGIPNHAFYLTAKAIGGRAWEKAGQVWYDTLTSGRLKPAATFAQFADATIAAASARYGESSSVVDAVRAGWTGVGVAFHGGAKR